MGGGTGRFHDADVVLPRCMEEPHGSVFVVPPPPAGISGQSPAASRGVTPKVDFTAILSDLDVAEAKVYGNAFAGFAPQGSTTPDDKQLRSFLLAHSAVASEELETELLKQASMNTTFCIDSAAFLNLVRDWSVNEDMAFQQFITLTSNGENIPSEDCRTGLRGVVEKLGVRLNDEQYERLVNTVMMDAGANVPMEQWIGYCKIAARITRLAILTKAILALWQSLTSACDVAGVEQRASEQAAPQE